MKKLYTLFSLLFMVAMLQAQVMVTFSVDMNNSGETVHPDGMHVAGSFQGWTSNGTPLDDTDGDGIWTVTVDIPAGDILFKFINGPDWGPNEFADGSVPDGGCAMDDGSGNINRTETIPAGETEYALPIYGHNSCESVLNTQDPNATALDLKASPNPFYGNTLLTFNNPNNQQFQVQVTDMTGRLVRSYQNVTGENLMITDLTNPGIYFATLINEVGANATFKIVVQ